MKRKGKSGSAKIYIAAMLSLFVFAVFGLCSAIIGDQSFAQQQNPPASSRLVIKKLDWLGNPLPGATFKATIENSEDDVEVWSGEAVSNENGEVIFDNIQNYDTGINMTMLDDYIVTIEEVAPPEGYEAMEPLTGEVFSGNPDYPGVFQNMYVREGYSYPIVDYYLEITDVKEKGDFNIYKVDENGSPIPDVEFEVWAKGEVILEGTPGTSGTK